jgi:ATP-dependent exoDNAse (exonuclease V) beta subunit
VERASRNVRGVNVLLESLEHFSGRLIRKRKGKNALGFDAMIDEVQDLFCDHSGFA